MKVYTHIEVAIPGETRWDRARTFFGHLDCRVYLSRDAFIDVGAGSLNSTARVALMRTDHVGSVGTIGRHCEFGDCTVMAGGEHANDQPVNMAFGGIPVIQSFSKTHPGLQPTPLIDIGNAVVISLRATVLSGASIGDGAVIGAGAVLTKPAEAFGIYAGVPARKLRDRMDPETIETVRRVAWWNFAPGYIAANIDNIQDVATTEGEHVYLRADAPRLVLTIADGLANTRVLGVQYTDGGRHLDRCSPELQAYAGHAFGPGPYEWVADPTI